MKKYIKLLAVILISAFVVPAGRKFRKRIAADFDEIIPKAEQFNEAFRKGLPAVDSAVLDPNKVSRQYYDVAPDCPYQTIAELKAAAAEVYSTNT